MYYLSTGRFKTKSSSVLKLHFCCCFLLDSNARNCLFDLRLGLFLLSKPEKSPRKSQQERFFSHTSLLYSGSVLSSLRPKTVLKVKLNSGWCNYDLKVRQWLQLYVFQTYIKRTVKLQQAGKWAMLAMCHWVTIPPQRTQWEPGEWSSTEGGRGSHSFSSGFWGSNSCTCVNGKSPFLPLTSPSHCPFMFILVTFTISPTCRNKNTRIIPGFSPLIQTRWTTQTSPSWGRNLALFLAEGSIEKLLLLSYNINTLLLNIIMLSVLFVRLLITNISRKITELHLFS